MKRLIGLGCFLLINVTVSGHAQPGAVGHTVKSNWLVGDFIRAGSGAVLGGLLIGMTLGSVVSPQGHAEFYAGPNPAGFSIGAALGSALGASWFLYHSHNREGGFGGIFLKTAWLTLLITLPSAIKYANDRNDHNSALTSGFGFGAVAISTVWAMYNYRRQPLRKRNGLVLFPGTIQFQKIPGGMGLHRRRRVALVSLMSFKFK